MELFIPSIFNIVAGMSILASALHRLVKMYFSTPGDEQGGTSNHNAPNEDGSNVGDENNRNESDDGSSSSENDDLDTGHDQDATTADNAEETPPDLSETLLKSIRKIMAVA